MLDPALRALAHVLRTGSFDAAAQILGVTPSAISQRIKGLEERLGTPLVHRTQPCTGTAAGLRLLKHADDVSVLEADLARDLPALGSSADAHVRVAINADSLATWVLPALAACEETLFDVVVDDQDHAADLLQKGEVAAALGTRQAALVGCNRLSLGALRYRATASPAFMDRYFADGVTPDALRHAPCMTYNAKDNLQRDWISQTFGSLPPPPSHFFPSTRAFVDAAMLGLGWGMNPESLVAPLIASGKLVELVPETPLDTVLVWHVSRVSAQGLEPLTRAIRRAARSHLVQPTGEAAPALRQRQNSTKTR